jgi:hypothetical protein
MAYAAQCRLGSRLNAFRLDYYIQLVAWLDARAGIGRSGASRSDYYAHLNVVIDIGGVDFSGAILHGTLHVSEALNDEPDTCSFTLVPDIPAQPHVGDIVRIGMGTIENLEFGGRIVNIQHQREPAESRSDPVRSMPPFLQVMCTDYLPDLDQRLVNMSWPSQGGSTTILDVVNLFCQHNEPFTTFGVKPDLPVIAGFEVVNGRASEVVRRIVNLSKGGFYIGPGRDLHAWANGAETGYPDPAPLKLSQLTLKSFSHLEDGSQARTVVVVEGPRTTAPFGLPASSPTTSAAAGTLDYGIPIADATMFRGQVNFEARIGSQRVRVSGVGAAIPAGLGGAGELAADIVLGGLSWIPITFTDGGAFLADLLSGPIYTYAWVLIGEQYTLVMNYGGYIAVLVDADVDGYYAALHAPVTAGATVTRLAFFQSLQGETSIATAQSGPQPIRAQPAGSDVVGVVRRWPTSYGSWPPPNVEHLIQDGRYSFAGMTERALSELADFDHVAITAEWDTDDPNARVGRQQVVLLDAPDPLSTSFTILTSEITWPVSNHAPRRHCTGGTTKHADLLDIMQTSKD